MLELHHISKQFGTTEALSHIDLTFQKGEVTFIVGESGSGKTTLLQLLGGTEAPSQGEIRFRGKNITEDTTAFRAEHVGFIYQDFNLITGLTVEENILLGSSICGKKIPEERLREITHRLALPKAEQKAQTLSGGEKQRVAIARALLKDADIILADEPTGNLDPANADKTFHCLRELREGRYIIIVTHDQERAHRYGDRVISLERGKVVKDERITKADTAPETKKDPPPATAYRRCPSPVAVLAKNSLRRRWARVLAIAFVLALTMTTLAMAFDLQGLGKQVEKNINIGYLDTDMLKISKRGIMEQADTFTPEEIAALPHIQNAKKIVKTYQGVHKFLFTNPDPLTVGSMYDVSLKVIDFDEFFKDRIGADRMNGTFPTKEDEVILASDIAEALFGGASPIGRQVTIQNGSGQARTLTVCAVNETVNPYGEVYSYVSSAIMEQMETDYVKAQLDLGIYLFANWKTEKQILTGAEQLLYGRAPAADNEILLSHTMLVDYPWGDEKLTLNDVEEGRVPAELLEVIYATERCLQVPSYDIRPMRVVGIYYLPDADPNGDGTLRQCMGFTEEVWQGMHAVHPNEIEVYFDGVEAATAARDAAMEVKTIFVESKLQTLQERVDNWSMLYMLTMVVISIVLGVILLVLLFAFSRILLVERKYELAILRSLGAGGRTVFAVVLCDFAAIYLIALVLSAVLTIFYPLCFSSLLSESLSYVRLVFPIRALFAVNGLSLVALALLVCPAIFRVMKITPATLLKSE